MWLLDKNLPKAFYLELSSRNIRCQSAGSISLDFIGRPDLTLGNLENGALTRAAVSLGFKALLTRDKTYAIDAKAALAEHRPFLVVVILFEQSPHDTLRARFAGALDTFGQITSGAADQISHWPPGRKPF